MKILTLVLVLTILVGCAGKSSTELKAKIEAKETSIKKISSDLKPGQEMPSSEREELETLLTTFTKEFPTDEYAPVCLDKLHMLYSGKGDYERSSEYGDILINDYPLYKNRPLILESMAANYDYFILPRDTIKVKFYNELLLKENPNLPKDKIEGIQFKLDNLNLSMEELIIQMNQ